MSTVAATGTTTTTAAAGSAAADNTGVAGGNSAPIAPGAYPAPTTPYGQYFNPFQEILQLIQQLMQRLQQQYNYPPQPWYPPTPPPPPVTPPTPPTGDRRVASNLWQGQQVGALDSSNPKFKGRTGINVEKVYEAHSTLAGAEAAAKRLSVSTGQPLAVVASREPIYPILYGAADNKGIATTENAQNAPGKGIAVPALKYRTVYNVVKLDPTIDLSAASRVRSYAGDVHIKEIVEGKQVKKVSGKDLPNIAPPPPATPGPVPPAVPVDPWYNPPIIGPYPPAPPAPPAPTPYPYHKYAVGGNSTSTPAIPERPDFGGQA